MVLQPQICPLGALGVLTPAYSGWLFPRDLKRLVHSHAVGFFPSFGFSGAANPPRLKDVWPSPRQTQQSPPKPPSRSPESIIFTRPFFHAGSSGPPLGGNPLLDLGLVWGTALPPASGFYSPRCDHNFSCVPLHLTFRRRAALGPSPPKGRF